MAAENMSAENISAESTSQSPAPRGSSSEQAGPSGQAGKPSPSERLKALVAEWGALLAVVWFGLFAIVLVGFALAIQLGFEAQSTAGTLGTWGAAYVATELTKPLRFAATAVITPALGTLLRRFRRRGAHNVAAEKAAPEMAEPALDESPSER
jgi:hypothetical protein